MMNYAHSSKRLKINYGTKESPPMGVGNNVFSQDVNMGGMNDPSFKKSCVQVSRRGGVSKTPDVYPK